MSPVLPLLVVFGWAAILHSQELAIGRSPILSASLPAASTWQVEMQQGAGPWTASGVLVTGLGGQLSIRMDGRPPAAKYRFQRVAGGVATVTPTLSHGMHLAGRQPGATQLQVQSSPNLAAWNHHALIFLGTDDRYLCALREPLGTRRFFRAGPPDLPVGDASVAAHDTLPNNQGSAGFGPVFDDMPEIFRNGFVAALPPEHFHRGGQNAAGAGECYELAGPFGRTTVIVSDITTSAPPGTIAAGRGFFDLGRTAYAALSGGPQDGAQTAGYRLVPAPVTGNAKFFVLPGASIYYTELRPYNHRAGIDKIELRNNGGTTWINLPRTAYNAFVYQAGGTVPPMAFPVQVRITSRFGEVITFPAISSMADNQRFTGPAQFTTFASLAPVPERPQRPVYREGLTSVPGDQWSAMPYGGANFAATASTSPYRGAQCARLGGLGDFGGVVFSGYPEFPRPEFGVLKLAIRSGTALPADRVGLIPYGRAASSPTQINGQLVSFPPLGTSWQVIEIPLETSTPAVIWGFSIVGRIGGALPDIWLDEVWFERR